jgi:hypothetical protein
MLGLDLQGAAAEVRADHRCCRAAQSSSDRSPISLPTTAVPVRA